MFSGAQLKKIREMKGLTQQQVAECMGVQAAHVSRLESGRHAPTFAMVERVADCLGVPTDALREKETSD